jgi:hypothetical protein
LNNTFLPYLVNLGVRKRAPSKIIENNPDSKLMIELRQYGMGLIYKNLNFMLRITIDDNLVGFLEIVSIKTSWDAVIHAEFLLKN